jgi:hypothetical protein
MYYLIIEVVDVSYKEDIYLALQSIGISRASTLDSRNISGELTDEFTFFTGFFRSDKLKAEEQMMITAQVRTRDQVKEFLGNLREGGVDIDANDVLSVTLIPAALTFNSAHGFYEDESEEE